MSKKQVIEKTTNLIVISRQMINGNTYINVFDLLLSKFVST